MSYDGNGNYTVPAGTTAVTGTVIDSADYNALLADLQTALTKALLRDGQSAALANLPMGGYKLTGLAAGSSANDSVRFDQLTAGSIVNTPAGGIAATTVQAALNELDTEKTSLASPTFTGTPAAPTASAGTNTTQLATTAFVQQEVPAASTTAAGKVELATSAEAQAGTDTTRAITATAMKAAQIQLQTAVTLTTQTEVGFTGIPSWAKRITVNFAGVSTNGSVAPKIQLGDSGGYETTGYLGSMSGGGNGSTLAAANATDSILLHVSPGAGSIMHGSVVLSLISASTNTWAASGVVGRSDVTNAFFVGASKSLDSTLDRLRIYINGTDQFDAGTVNVSYE